MIYITQSIQIAFCAYLYRSLIYKVEPKIYFLAITKALLNHYMIRGIKKKKKRKIIHSTLMLWLNHSRLTRPICRSKIYVVQSVQFQTKIRNISLRRACSPKNAEFSYFTLLFCRGRLKIAHTCTAIVLLCKS